LPDAGLKFVLALRDLAFPQEAALPPVSSVTWDSPPPRERPITVSSTIGDSRPDSETRTMTEPTLTCPTCRTEIKLTESLAAPLIEGTRRRYEDQLTRKEAVVACREAAIREQQAQIAAAKDSIDTQVAARIDEERSRIAATEAQKAKRLVAIDFDHKVKQIAELNEVLRQRDAKLAEAQQAHADLIRKQRELDDAKKWT
jgi:hypothetical protein